MNNKAEILAPAGSFETLVAAVRCGADAVYFGGKAFNARRGAANFNTDEFARAVAYCHARGVGSHITLNTLVSDGELAQALEEIKHVSLSGADVLILQDLGVATLVRSLAPDVARHASTQMSVQTPAGVRLLKKLGYHRVVLPRELSKKEITEIVGKAGIETEVFVHGALCMCVSGQCYMSAMLGSRSGNRGLCAQPCRLPFKVDGGTGFDLSLKDNSLVPSLNELAEIGVDSFKIEGRMKRPEYVAAAVTACKKSLRGDNCEEEMRRLGAVFSRSGFTDGYYSSALGKDMFGIRRKEDVSAAQGVLKDLARLYEKEPQSIAVDFVFSALDGCTVTLSASANGVNVFVNSGEVPQKALNAATQADALKDRLAKCGGTPFYAQNVEIELDEGLYIPAALINGVRRQALDLLYEKLSAVKAKSFTQKKFNLPEHTADERRLNALFYNEKSIPDDLSGLDLAFVPYDTNIEKMHSIARKGVTVGAMLPRGLFGMEKQIARRLAELKAAGITHVNCGNLDALQLAREAGMDIHAGFGLNVFNSLSLELLSRLDVKEATVSFELTLSQIQRLKGELPRGVVAYGRLPLMITRNCPIKNGKTCAECKKSGYLTDRMGVRFPVRCFGACSEVFNSRPVYLADRLNEIKNVDYLELMFTTETKDECAKVIDAYRNGLKPEGEYTRGLYYRGVE